MERIVFVLLCAVLSIVDASKILVVVPTPSISHQVVFRPIIKELVKKGHEVTYITTDPMYPEGKAPKNLTEIDIHDMSYKVWREMIFSSDFSSGSSKDLTQGVMRIYKIITPIFEQQIQLPEVKLALSKAYDLLILEAWAKPAFIIMHLCKEVPTILVSSFNGINGNYETVGAPVYPALIYPTVLRQRLSDLSLSEKLTELYTYTKMNMFFITQDTEFNKFFKKMLGPDAPTVRDLEKNVDMFFVNYHPLWDMNRPVPPSVVYIGGIHQNPSKELPQDLKQYLDSSKHGVIYISYGTNVSPSQLPPEKIQILTRAFSKLPYDVLWKWDKDVLPGQSSNIRLSKWLPQSDLLKHPKVKLFITQGGLQSTDEAITAGVPLIGMPMLGDQWFNVEQYLRHKVGLRMDMDTLTEEGFLKAVNTVIDDKSFRKNMEKLRSLMHDQPQSALDRAVWWVEHLLRHGSGKHLRAPAANMTWSEYLDLELMAVLALIAFSILAGVVVALYVVIRIVKKYLVPKKKLKQS